MIFEICLKKSLLVDLLTFVAIKNNIMMYLKIKKTPALEYEMGILMI